MWHKVVKKNRAFGSTKNIMFIVHSISWVSLSSHAIIIHQIAHSNSCYSLIHIMTRCYEDSTFAVPTTSRPIFPLSLAATLPLTECTVSRERALTYSFGRCENPPRPRVLVQVAGNCFSEREHRAYRAIRAENRCCIIPRSVLQTVGEIAGCGEHERSERNSRDNNMCTERVCEPYA